MAVFICFLFRWFVGLFVCRQRVVVAHWLTGARVLLLADVSSYVISRSRLFNVK